MQKSIFTLFLFFFFANLLLAQDYPPDPKPGMCYIRCKKELVEKKVKHVVVPEYKESSTLAIPGKPQKTWGALANAISIPNRSSPWDF